MEKTREKSQEFHTVSLSICFEKKCISDCRERLKSNTFKLPQLFIN